MKKLILEERVFPRVIQRVEDHSASFILIKITFCILETTSYIIRIIAGYLFNVYFSSFFIYLFVYLFTFGKVSIFAYNIP